MKKLIHKLLGAIGVTPEAQNPSDIIHDAMPRSAAIEILCSHDATARERRVAKDALKTYHLSYFPIIATVGEDDAGKVKSMYRYDRDRAKRTAEEHIAAKVARLPLSKLIQLRARAARRQSACVHAAARTKVIKLQQMLAFKAQQFKLLLDAAHQEIKTRPQPKQNHAH